MTKYFVAMIVFMFSFLAVASVSKEQGFVIKDGAKLSKEEIDHLKPFLQKHNFKNEKFYLTYRCFKGIRGPKETKVTLNCLQYHVTPAVAAAPAPEKAQEKTQDKPSDKVPVTGATGAKTSGAKTSLVPSSTVKK